MVILEPTVLSLLEYMLQVLLIKMALNCDVNHTLFWKCHEKFLQTCFTILCSLKNYQKKHTAFKATLGNTIHF